MRSPCRRPGAAHAHVLQSISHTVLSQQRAEAARGQARQAVHQIEQVDARHDLRRDAIHEGDAQLPASRQFHLVLVRAPRLTGLPVLTVPCQSVFSGHDLG